MSTVIVYDLIIATRFTHIKPISSLSHLCISCPSTYSRIHYTGIRSPVAVKSIPTGRPFMTDTSNTVAPYLPPLLARSLPSFPCCRPSRCISRCPCPCPLLLPLSLPPSQLLPYLLPPLLLSLSLNSQQPDHIFRRHILSLIMTAIDHHELLSRSLRSE